MSTRYSQWSDAGTRRMDFGGGGGGGKMEWVFGGALVAIILFAMVMMYFSIWGGPSITYEKNPEWRLECTNEKCGEVLVKRLNDFTEAERQGLMFGPMGGGGMMMPPMGPDGVMPQRLLCEKCQEPMGRQKKCPSCEGWYLDPMERHHSYMSGEDICPHCDTDIRKFYEQRAAEMKGKKK